MTAAGVIGGLFRRPTHWLDRQAIVRNTESGALLLYLFLLPVAESPKTIALAAFLVAAVAHLWMEGRVWRRPGPLEASVLALLAVFIASALAAAAGDGTGQAFAKVRGLRYAAEACLLFVLVWRGGYTGPQRLLMLGVLIAGTAVAAVIGEWRFLTGRTDLVYLAAIGGANSSGMYAAVMLGVAIGCLAGGWEQASLALRLTLIAVVAAGAVLLIGSWSRGAVFAFVVLLGTMMLNASRRAALILLATALAGVGAALLLSPEVFDKFARMRLDGAEGIFGPRLAFWRVALEAGLQNPVLGIGPGNFKLQDVGAYGLDLDPAGGVMHPGHAHNLLLAFFAEEGALGVLAILAFVAFAGQALWQARRVEEGTWRVLWYAGLSAWVVFVANGLFLDTFHREKGQLVLLLMALALAPDPQRAAPAPGRARARISSMSPAATSRPR